MTQTKDMFSAWDHLNWMLIEEPKSVNIRGEYYLHLFENVVQTLSCKAPGLFLEELGYTDKKLTHLIGSYINPVNTKKWLFQIYDTTKAWGQVDTDVFLYTKTNTKHSAGPCLIGFSYRSRPEPTLTVYSRSAEFPQKAGADVLLISALGQLICKRLGLKDLRVTWFIGTVWTKSRTAPFYRLYCYPDYPAYANKEFEAHLERGWQRYLINQETATFSKLKRLQELYHLKKGGKLKGKTGANEFFNKLEGYIDEKG